MEEKKYKHPPLIETVLGVQFNPLIGFASAHLGAFWSHIGASEWPVTSDAPPLPPQFEQFSETDKWEAGLRIQISSSIQPRLQLSNQLGDKMIQIQNGRLHFNWRKQNDAAGYPKYQSVRDSFKDVFSKFLDFTNGVGLGNVEPNQWEVTYVNVMPKGGVWQDENDWSFLKLLSPVPPLLNTSALESFSGEWHFKIPDNVGRVHLHCQHGFNEQLDTDVLRLAFTARGPVHQDSQRPLVQQVVDGCDVGHDAIRQLFELLFTESAKKHWGAEK